MRRSEPRQRGGGLRQQGANEGVERDGGDNEGVKHKHKLRRTGRALTERVGDAGAADAAWRSSDR